MKLRGNHMIIIMLIFMVVISFSVTSCFIFFMEWSPEELLIDEDFNDGIADFWIMSSGSWTTTGSEYMLTTTSAIYDCYGSYYNEPDNNSFNDYTFEANLIQMSGDLTDNKFGLFFRCFNPASISGNPPTHNGYMLYIRMTDGTVGPFWGLQRWDGAGALNTLIPETSHPALNDYHGMTNVVKVDVSGDKIDIYFNDVFIQTFYDPDYWYGYVGLFGWGGASVNDFRFDNVKLRAVKE